jgi:hypothetical protein
MVQCYKSVAYRGIDWHYMSGIGSYCTAQLDMIWHNLQRCSSVKGEETEKSG